ncbi:phage holin family protein [Persicitalea jodogahamensis]|uniref:Membrane protein n=1 Tax=Persicitalea jodogahamensis TaxID=402147 RepID=A0A8J3D401_9BACT|nr:phage holin family protein [Persicitalea jodogahamensis]GHB69135.1 membrane protein [Persicitalea jodogahamensis]
MNLLLRLVISTVAIIVAANLLDGVVVTNVTTALIAAIVLGFLNAFVRPVLQILALPITILTLGLFYFVINILMVYFAAALVDGFAVNGFISAALFALIVAVISGILGMFLD